MWPTDEASARCQEYREPVPEASQILQRWLWTNNAQCFGSVPCNCDDRIYTQHDVRGASMRVYPESGEFLAMCTIDDVLLLVSPRS